MTRFLSESLQAEEPFFRMAVQRMEAARGHQNMDIRLSSQVQRQTREKIKALGLDPDDTTPEELYHALQERLKADDARLTKVLRTMAATHVSAEAEVVSGMVHALRNLPDSKKCFAMKNSVLRSVLKKQPPKKAMKRLGYRSMDSFLKHEPPVSVLAAAYLTEGVTWQHRLLESYKKLGPSDFEERNMDILRPDSARWRDLSQDAVSRRRHNILCIKELGALVMLPLPEDAPSGAVTASLSLALHDLNGLRAASSFLKLCQVRPDFGDLVRLVASDEPQLAVRLLDQPVSWQLVQQYYADMSEKFRETAFEPHVRVDDIAWHSVEESLTAIDPGLKFWQDSSHLGVLHRRSPVSMNVVDAALNRCKQLPFERRMAHYFQKSLWHELMLRYMDADDIESSVMQTLQPEMVEETVAV